MDVCCYLGAIVLKKCEARQLWGGDFIQKKLIINQAASSDGQG